MSSEKNIKHNCGIIVIDDDKDFLNFLSVVLQLDGYNVLAYTNLISALIKLKKFPNCKNNYILIITKVYSPLIYAIELIKIIKILYPNIKVILTSPSDIDKFILYNIVFDGYLTKPVTIYDFRQSIKKFTNLSENKNYKSSKSVEFIHSL